MTGTKGTEEADGHDGEQAFVPGISPDTNVPPSFVPVQ
jgi:hypothetical protein